MSRKVTTIEHVYEFTFRVVSAEELDEIVLAEQATEALMTSQLKAGAVDVRELCFDTDAGDTCLMTEGHRGLHTGVAGRRWGTDL